MNDSAHEAENFPTETLFDGQWLRIRRRGRWEYVERSHGNGLAVVIVAVTPDDKLLFVEQFRVPLGQRTIELPAGLVGDDHAHDTLEAAAHRELVEETGWEPDRVEVLLVGATSAGMSTERAAFVRATGLRRVGAGGGVDGEGITVHEIPRAEAAAWLVRQHAAGYEVDLKLWAGLWLLDRNPDGTPSGV